ncbi:Uncharacterised protein [Serratia fonticola]|uniref:Uncharacterized protein n=1 Tax=Serratia fonticola TaxID=47917 RepID=A0A4V6KTJ0_SERFO|nr:Uncharacterised protein [Serratia fonticola]
MQFLPLIGGKGKIGERPLFGLNRCLGQHLVHDRYALTMATGIGALGVDRSGDQLNKGSHQILLLLQQILRLYRYR